MDIRGARARPWLGLLALAASFGLCRSGEVLASGVDAIIGARSLLGRHPQLSWPATGGSILGSEMWCRDTGGDETRWTFTVQFSYEIAGSAYADQQEIDQTVDVYEPALTEAERRWVARPCETLFGGGDKADAEFRTVSAKFKYDVGERVPVYYDPENHREGVVVPGLNMGMNLATLWDSTYGDWLVLLAALALLIAGIVLLWRWFAGVVEARKPSA